MDIILHHHLGLGDHFICNALVLEISKRYDHVYLISWSIYYPTVKHLYEDVKNITVQSIFYDPAGYNDEYGAVLNLSKKLNVEILRIGGNKCDINDFERSFYHQIGLDPDLQFTGFMLPKDLSESEKLYNDWIKLHGQDYIFVHDTSSVGKFDLAIENTLPQYRVDVSQTNDLIDYATLICNASEIHFINSSIRAMVLPLKRQDKIKAEKIFYHDTRDLWNGGIPVVVPPELDIIVVEYTDVIERNLIYQSKYPGHITKKYRK